MKKSILLLTLVSLAIWTVFTYAEVAPITAKEAFLGESTLEIPNIQKQYILTIPQYVKDYAGKDARIADTIEWTSLVELERQKTEYLNMIARIDEKIAAIQAIAK